MLSLSVRRAIVWVLSIAFGIISTQVTFLILGTTWGEFGLEAIVVVISLGAAALIWIDKFMSAEILPD